MSNMKSTGGKNVQVQVSPLAVPIGDPRSHERHDARKDIHRHREEVCSCRRVSKLWA
jgi:hypothetical protein